MTLLITALLLGLLLILVEIILIPGTTFVGLLGGLVLLVALVATFVLLGPAAGLLVTFGSGLVVAGTFYWMLKSKTWKRFMLLGDNKSQVNTSGEDKLQAGMVGETVSLLRPSGKAVFEGEYFEVHSTKGYIQVNTSVRIVDIDNYKVYVEPLN